MATISSSLVELPLEQLALYHVMDPYLSSVFVFYGSVATANSTASSTRNQAHIFTAAGVKSYPRIIVSPAAPLYAAVNHLPREKQGDETCRGLAVSLLKYFKDLSDPAKDSLTQFAKAGKSSGRIPKMFEESHAAELANRMARINNTSEIVRDLRDAYEDKKVPWIDVDVIIPAGSMVESAAASNQSATETDEVIDDSQANKQYGKYSPLIESLGDPMFLPTSRLRRAPSQPTNLSKSKVFTKIQKESLRLAMCEVVDTEERYVSKVYDLVHNVVQEFQQKARSKTVSSSSPDETALAELFPPCLNEILEVNMGFLEVIRQILENTEHEAIADLAQDTDLQTSTSSRNLAKEGKDPLGTVAFANALIEWFPRFSTPYADYMKAHTGFTQTLNSFLRDEKSSFSRRVYETGEQKLRSLLMEPVQRLPRYSLLIDAMTNNIPSIHPSVRLFLKARDIIKDICSLDTPANTDYSQSLKRVVNLVEYWPPPVIPQGRLINAVDSSEILPPFRVGDQDHSVGNNIMMLLYRNCLVLLSRTPGSQMTARTLLSEVENQASPVSQKPLSQTNPQFRFIRAFDLATLFCLQSDTGHILYLMPSSGIRAEALGSTQSTPQALLLSGIYEGRASRFIEEILKAKIEGRFSERERESGKWTLRSPTVPSGSLGILAPVFEEGPSGSMQRSGCSRIRMVFDTPKAICMKTLDNASVDLIVSVTLAESNQYRMEISTTTGFNAVEIVSTDEFVSTLSARLCTVLPAMHHPQNPSLSETLVYANLDILRQIGSHIISQTRASRGFRPPSPTKLISNLWGGSQQKDPPMLSKAFNPTLALGDIPKMAPKSSVRPTTSPSTFDEPPPKISIVAPTNAKENDRLQLLEQTFSSYILALRSRSGNIVGRSLRARASADRTLVNELYNVLLEDPNKLQAAAEVPVDVLFVAFETFITNAWKDQIGSILPPDNLKAVQTNFDSLFPRDFENFFRQTINELSPQNRRALTAMVRLLSELLDASGNDGDRGALTAAFAEILTINEEPMQYISLLDRLVDDFDKLFEETTNTYKSHETTPSRPLSSHAGSIGSNASSFRKRFGFGLNRENSTRSDGESKVSSLIRTLSKTKNLGNDPEGKIPLSRSRSTDTDSRLVDLLRPSPRERPTLYGAFLSEDNIRRPGSAHDDSFILHSIDERPSTPQKDPGRRKKRRSSLSDLPTPITPTRSAALSPIDIPKPLTPASRPRPQSEFLSDFKQIQTQDSPVTSSPSRIPQTPHSPARIVGSRRPASPVRRPTSPIRLGSPVRKENAQPRPKLTERAVNKKTESPMSPLQTRKKRSDTLTSIPQPAKTPLQSKDRPFTSHGPDSLNRRDILPSSPQKSQRLRVQSPQKLRDRLQSEKQAQSSAESTFQSELQLIGEEISALTWSSSPTKQRRPTSSDNSLPGTMISRVRSLENRFATFSTEINNRTAALQKDLEVSLAVSEKRAKKLDELYRDASAENEALYDKFNKELSRVVKDIRAGNGEQSLQTQLSEALEELGRVKKENLRLKREVGGLKAVRADTESQSRKGGSGDDV
ncbi:putative Rho guanyl nucleotide exchange factor [Talaromyces proteolyticus]|uniref:Rho guanyl nucleotide exchange factor n=1 Tax=Talaromyces proteolyticus TaxID=1131652 RepID=A0AAD4L1X5_9EURO|nr:putative Rho guanyl nucleotide exchange factor [Talaromyces proteolyticus]KAH8705105.1 putative Rho guanyl nucleotide exchange factor [Talaromyces proteolyticus]